MIQRLVLLTLLIGCSLYGSNFGTISTGGKDGTYILIVNDNSREFEKKKNYYL